jgi:opacity protein-like surface antigen
MKHKVIMIMAAVAAAGVVHAAEVTASADFASAYIFRGTTFNDGLVMQPGVSVAGFPIPTNFGSVTLGTWANFDIEDYGGRLEENEFSEIDYYATYALPVKVVDLSTTYTEYTYPNGGSADREIAFAVGKAIGESGLYPSITANYGLDGVVEQSWYIQSGLGYSKDLTEKLNLSSSLKAAYVFSDEGEDGFNDAIASLGLAYALTDKWSIKGSVNYVEQLDDEVLTDEAYDESFYGMIGLACTF